MLGRRFPHHPDLAWPLLSPPSMSTSAAQFGRG
jgi:hypothetical protein